MKIYNHGKKTIWIILTYLEKNLLRLIIYINEMRKLFIIKNNKINFLKFFNFYVKRNFCIFLNYNFSVTIILKC